jgi:hypothetical protein
MLKTMCFFTFHLWKAFREYKFYCAKKSLDMLVDLGNPMPKRLRNVFSQLCHRHLGSSSKMELVMEALYASTGLEASRPLPTIFVGSSMGLSFWAKAIGFPSIFQVFGYVQV